MHTQHKSFGGDDPQHPVETGRVVNTLAQAVAPVTEEATDTADTNAPAEVKPVKATKPKSTKPKKAKPSA